MFIHHFHLLPAISTNAIDCSSDLCSLKRPGCNEGLGLQGKYSWVFLMQVCPEKSSEMWLQDTPTSITILGQIKFLLLVLLPHSPSVFTRGIGFGQQIPLQFAVAGGSSRYAGVINPGVSFTLGPVGFVSVCPAECCPALTDLHHSTSGVLAIFRVLWAWWVRTPLSVEGTTGAPNSDYQPKAGKGHPSSAALLCGSSDINVWMWRALCFNFPRIKDRRH